MKFQNGGSLTKQDIKNIKGFNLTETFDPIKMWDIVKGGSEVNNFFNSYINSSGFKRIINNQKTWWKKRHPYRKWIKNPPVARTIGYYKAAERYTPNYYIAKLLPIELSVTKARYDQPNRPVLNYKDILIGQYGNEFPFDFTAMHEYSHGKEPYGFWGWWSDEVQKEALDQNKNTKLGHDSKDEEKLADIQGLKYLLYKEGIYDVRKNKDITIPKIQKLRNKYPKLRPFKQMNNKQLQFQLNHVAMNESNQNINIV